MSKSLKVILSIIVALILSFILIFISYYLYVNKPNNLNPEETIKKYMSYWEDDFTVGMKSLESKDAEFVDVIRNLHDVTKIKSLRIEDVTAKEIDYSIDRYNGNFSRENLRIYYITFYALSDDEIWNGKNTFIVDLVYEKQGWLVASLGNP